MSFHRTHFTIYASSKDSPEHYDEGHEDDSDDLGYYPDGNKRTLTEEQIAIFRHSEIQELLKIHQAAIDDGLPSPFTKSEATVTAELVGKSLTQNDGSEPGKADDYKSSAFRADDSLQSGKSIPKVASSGPTKTKRKRKRHAKGPDDIRHNPQKYIADGDERTFRRIAREMDSQKESAVDLDY
jgi:hypothetical protein